MSRLPLGIKSPLRTTGQSGTLGDLGHQPSIHPHGWIREESHAQLGFEWLEPVQSLLWRNGLVTDMWDPEDSVQQLQLCLDLAHSNFLQITVSQLCECSSSS